MSLLFKKIVFGPIHSRRLGLSLGINLLSTQRKYCNFNCIYCECGWNPRGVPAGLFPQVSEVSQALEDKLKSLNANHVKPDALTFSGNGEPTLHPRFLEIVRETRRLRDLYMPEAKICVLSNAGMIHKPEVFEALLLADRRILKLDSAFEDTLYTINQPNADYSMQRTLEYLRKFQGRFTLQTLFLRGRHSERSFDNTAPREVEAWLKIVSELRPEEVMVYTLDRATPEKNLEKIPLPQLEGIAQKVREMNIPVTVAG